jgi:hypothetical protein
MSLFQKLAHFVTGPSSLARWQEALELFTREALDELAAWDGYMVNSNAGQMIATFVDPARAIR